MGDDIYEEDDEKPKKKKVSSEQLVIQNIMRTQDGRDYMWKKLQDSSVFETMFNSDPILTAYNEGLRDSGVQLNRELKEAAPGDYVKMIQENIDG
jgi:hypothetical protein